MNLPLKKIGSKVYSQIKPMIWPDLFNKAFFMQSLNSHERSHWKNQIKNERLKAFDVATRMMLATDGLKKSEERIQVNHLYYIHKARLKMIHNLLPKAQRILDLGGANSPLYHMSYRHSFEYLMMVDLPQEQRNDLHKVTSEWSRRDGLGTIEILYADMTDLSSLESESFDLIWSGQSIEHITLEQGKKMAQAAYRLLKPKGSFCLDTPNRLMTQIHTASIGGGFIHPEHKFEYTPQQLRSLLEETGFKIVESKGICEMPETSQTKVFHYEDFLWGTEISDDVDSCYIQYFECKK